MVVHLDADSRPLTSNDLASPKSALAAVLSCPNLVESAVHLVLTQPAEPDPSGLLYLYQRECAFVRPTDPAVRLLASDDATTCHLVVVRNPVSGDTLMCHFDGVGASNLVNLIEKRFHGNSGAPPNLDLHLVGGFPDSRGESASLTRQILRAFSRSRLLFRLRTACVAPSNGTRRGDADDEEDDLFYPAITGLAVSVADGSLKPVRVPLAVRGPWKALRGLRFLCHEDVVFEVYDPDSHCLVLKPFDYSASQRLFDSYADAPDSALIKLSTSPRQEPAHFTAELRRALRFGRANKRPARQVFHLGDIVARPLPDGAWQHVAGPAEPDGCV